ncbi:hypothetical protein V8D89_003737, partial [Ganoderma adspersum]
VANVSPLDPATAHYPPPYVPAINVNQHLQQLGFPQFRLALRANSNTHDPNNCNPLAPPGVPSSAPHRPAVVYGAQLRSQPHPPVVGHREDVEAP